MTTDALVTANAKLVGAFLFGAIAVGSFAYFNSRSVDCSKVMSQARDQASSILSLEDKLADDQTHLNKLLPFPSSDTILSNARESWQLHYQTDSNGLIAAKQGLREIKAKYPACF